MAGLTVLHTSDWHLGNQLYRKKRDQEFSAFLDWLAQTIDNNRVDVLLIAGDVFDVGNPGTTAQRQYYSFLGKILGLGVRHVVIVAGNHDSPAFLAASAPILQNLQIHVVGSCSESPEDEIITLYDNAGQPELIVCAAPYLREGDICHFLPGETNSERDKRLLEGLREHFKILADTAGKLREEYEKNIPIIATAHLFTAGVAAEKEDSVRDLYRGNMGCVPSHYFPDTFDYVALGHIHKPYAVDKSGLRRYSGSPLPLSFAEAKYEKKLALLRFNENRPEVGSITVPVFQQMKTVDGNSQEILSKIAELVESNRNSGENIWLEINHDGTDSVFGLPGKCQELVQGSGLEILCIKTKGATESPASLELERGLDDLEPADMFRRCLEHQKIPEDEWSDLEASFQELLTLTLESSKQCES